MSIIKVKSPGKYFLLVNAETQGKGKRLESSWVLILAMYCSFIGTPFNLQNTHHDLQQSITAVPGYLTPLITCVGTGYTHDALTYIQANNHTHKMNFKILKCMDFLKSFLLI